MRWYCPGLNCGVGGVWRLKRQVLVVEARVVTEHEMRHRPKKAAHLVELFARSIELDAETSVDVFIEVFEQDAPSRFNASLYAGVQFCPEATEGAVDLLRGSALLVDFEDTSLEVQA